MNTTINPSVHLFIYLSFTSISPATRAAKFPPDKIGNGDIFIVWVCGFRRSLAASVGPYFLALFFLCHLKNRGNFPQKVTVRVVLPEIVPEAAVMVTMPAVTAVARPLLLIVVTEELEELQFTDPVIL